MLDGEIRGRAETELRRGIPSYDDDLHRRTYAELPEVRLWHGLRTVARWCRRQLRPRSSP